MFRHNRFRHEQGIRSTDIGDGQMAPGGGFVRPVLRMILSIGDLGGQNVPRG